MGGVSGQAIQGSRQSPEGSRCCADFSGHGVDALAAWRPWHGVVEPDAWPTDGDIRLDG